MTNHPPEVDWERLRDWGEDERSSPELEEDPWEPEYEREEG
jgi:hypothetical protein